MSRILIGLVSVWLFAGGFVSTKTSACGDPSSPQKDCKPCKRPDGSLNHSPNVTDVILDKTQVRLKDLTPGAPPDIDDRTPDMMINVATNAQDAENDVLDYYYVISGGRIVGSGSSVQWDLNGVLPGTYSITARVDDSCGVCGSTKTKFVTVTGKMPIVAPAPAIPPVTKTAAQTTTSTPPTVAKSPTSVITPRPKPAVTSAAPSSPSLAAATAEKGAPAAASLPCSCPKIIIADPERSDAGLNFTAKIFDLPATTRLNFIWTVTGGSVVSQDGRSIRVKPGVLGGSVSVSVNGLDPKCGCPNSAQKTF
jgi:hypothetical protein